MVKMAAKRAKRGVGVGVFPSAEVRYGVWGGGERVRATFRQLKTGVKNYVLLYEMS